MRMREHTPIPHWKSSVLTLLVAARIAVAAHVRVRVTPRPRAAPRQRRRLRKWVSSFPLVRSTRYPPDPPRPSLHQLRGRLCDDPRATTLELNSAPASRVYFISHRRRRGALPGLTPLSGRRVTIGFPVSFCRDAPEPTPHDCSCVAIRLSRMQLQPGPSCARARRHPARRSKPGLVEFCAVATCDVQCQIDTIAPTSSLPSVIQQGP